MLRNALFSSSRALSSVPRTAASQSPLRLQTLRAHAAAWPLRSPRSAQPAITRWYSDIKETPAESEKTESVKTEAQTSDSDALAELKTSLEAKDAEAREWKDKCMRSVADFYNLQDRTAREVKNAREFAIQKFAKDLIESVDNLDRALTTVPAEKLAAKDESSQDLRNLYDGLKMTEKILMQTLAKHGLEPINPEGDKLNTNEHEASFMAHPDKENGVVFHVQQKGFKLNGRLLRAAKVIVVKND